MDHPLETKVLKLVPTALDFLHTQLHTTFSVSTGDIQIHALDGLARDLGAQAVTVKGELNETGGMVTLQVEW